MSSGHASASDDAFTIEQLASRTGMTVRNLRQYQSQKLLTPPEVRGRVGYYTRAHVSRVELIKDLQAEGFKLETIARMLDSTGAGDTQLLRFTRTVKTLFEESERQIVSRTELASRFSFDPDEDDLLVRAEKLGLLRRIDDTQFEELAPRVLRIGQGVHETLGLDLREIFRVLEQLRRHSGSVADLFLDLFLKRVWLPFTDAGQPDDQWPAVQSTLESMRTLAEEGLLAVFELVMAAQVNEAFGREVPRSIASARRSRKKAK